MSRITIHLRTMLLFRNCQSVLHFDKLKTARAIYGMIVAAGYRNW